ncbi:hypothetical protein EV385_3982 [Krasilnikovia cinnamomea]|uniref:Uncharacterized protein n=1 Tax=Krasilnikovia cinnamomea TaxID=349313 RepID=A0A4Q7ZMC2_9ACTN|nr:hypothetical protein [Krasilnikovia cinnamomea]RZU52140.1 hypothetical protein EV385_3982 [Krasilnikovia cinnamomea]
MTEFMIDNDEGEELSWTLAESLLEKARTMMQEAETALESFVTGKELNRQLCSSRGIGESDAEIRWNNTAKARKALADTTFNTTQATMYYGAATANFSRALYLRSHRREPV